MPSIISKRSPDQSIHWFRVEASHKATENTRCTDDRQEHNWCRVQRLAEAQVDSEERYNDKHVGQIDLIAALAQPP
jgi:hypothetical protein